MTEISNGVRGNRIELHFEISEYDEPIGSIADVSIGNILNAMTEQELIALKKRIETRLSAGMYRRLIQ